MTPEHIEYSEYYVKTAGLKACKMSFSSRHPKFRQTKIYPKKRVIFGNNKFATKQQKQQQQKIDSKLIK